MQDFNYATRWRLINNDESLMCMRTSRTGSRFSHPLRRRKVKKVDGSFFFREEMSTEFTSLMTGLVCCFGGWCRRFSRSAGYKQTCVSLYSRRADIMTWEKRWKAVSSSSRVKRPESKFAGTTRDQKMFLSLSLVDATNRHKLFFFLSLFAIRILQSRTIPAESRD